VEYLYGRDDQIQSDEAFGVIEAAPYIDIHHKAVTKILPLRCKETGWRKVKPSSGEAILQDAIFQEYIQTVVLYFQIWIFHRCVIHKIELTTIITGR
jgi:hypothetical protein